MQELIGSLFLILALAVIVGLFIARPFITGFKLKAGDAGQAREHQRSALLAERDRALNALQELDFDNALGKIPADEYPNQRASLLKTGADALRRLDEFDTSAQAVSITEAALASRSRSAEDRIEAAVAARRADARQGAAAGAAMPVVVAGNGNGHSQRTDELENIIASRKRERKESAGGFCPNCGKPVSKSDKFCSRCGATL